MDGTLNETHALEILPDPIRCSTFEMSINLEFQIGTHQQETATPKAGDSCPECESAKIDYDNLLNLSCPKCDYILAGCFT